MTVPDQYKRPPGPSTASILHRLSRQATAPATLDDAISRYLGHVRAQYKTREHNNIASGLIRFREAAGELPFETLGYDLLAAYQAELSDAGGLSITYANKLIAYVKRFAQWCRSERWIGDETLNALRSLPAIRPNRTNLRIPDPIMPAEQQTIRSWVTAFAEAEISPGQVPLISVVQMSLYFELMFCSLTCMRPSECLNMRDDEIDRSDDVWLYKPERHKTRHHGKSRVIALGFEAQKLIQRLDNFRSSPWFFEALERGRLSGRPLPYTSMLTRLYRFRDAYQLPAIKLNQGRKNSATELEACEGKAAAMGQLGHASDKLLRLYSKHQANIEAMRNHNLKSVTC